MKHIRRGHKSESHQSPEIPEPLQYRRYGTAIRSRCKWLESVQIRRRDRLFQARGTAAEKPPAGNAGPHVPRSERFLSFSKFLKSAPPRPEHPGTENRHRSHLRLVSECFRHSSRVVSAAPH